MVYHDQAFAYRRYLSQCNASRYLKLEQQAQHEGMGVWSVLVASHGHGATDVALG